jgi:hypothetical protein
MKLGKWILCAIAVLTAWCGGEQTNPDMQVEARSEELSSSCSGVMPPAAPSSWMQSQSVGTENGCGTDTSDVNGDVAIGRTFGPGSSQEWETDVWQLFTNRGTARGTIQQNNAALIFPQFSGFQTLGDQNGCGFNPNCHSDYGLRSWSPSGALTGQSVPSFRAWDAQIDLGGGVLLAGVTSQSASYQIVAQRFSSQSAPRSGQAVVATGNAQPMVVAGAVNLSGHTLVLWNGSFSGLAQDVLVGRWLDRNGHPLTAAFVVAQHVFFGNLPSGVSTTALLDNSIAVRAYTDSGGQAPAQRAWVARVKSASTSVGAVPSWLATRPDARVSIVRGGRAYALLFPIDTTTCNPAHVAMFAPSGTRCGGFDFDSGSPGPSCASDAFIGRDGTLFVRGSSDPTTRSCKDRVFPGLLK